MTDPQSPRLESLCVFCGASSGADPQYRDAASRLGRLLAGAGISLVYGGGHLGIMGALAEGTLQAGGRVIGVIPEHLVRVEVAFLEISELIVVDSMHTRKRRMFDLADAFCVMPGGFGTLDETFEILTWKQLRLHDKPVVLTNIGGFWDPWLALVNGVVGGGFAQPEVKRLFSVVDAVEDVLDCARREMRATLSGKSQLF